MWVVTKVLSVLIFWITLNDFTPTTALKDVHLTLPKHVRSGDDAVLTCEYNLEQETLNAIVWYKDNREFYRFTPKDPFNVKKFELQNDVDIDKSRSTAKTVVLSSLNRNGTGIYTCTVHTGSPNFNLAIDSDIMEVIDVPDSEPEINENERADYKMGDIFEANCTINSSPSMVNLAWLINGQELLLNKQSGNLENADLVGKVLATMDKNRVTLNLHLKLLLENFTSAKLTLECRAKTFNISERITQQIVLLDKTKNTIFVFNPPKSALKKHRVTRETNYETKVSVIRIPVGLIFFLLTLCGCCKCCMEEDENKPQTNPNENERRFVLVHPPNVDQKALVEK